MNKKITISFFILWIFIISTSGNVLAQTSTDPVEIKCTEEMKPFIKEKSAEFRAYLNEHFQNKSTNTSLLDLALKRFDVYKKDLRTKYESYFPQAGFTLYSETQKKLSCAKQMNDEIRIMEELLKSYYKQTSNIKTSTAFMTKLQQINKKLDQLSLEVTQMLGKWNSLKSRIPCFIKKCL